MANANIFASMLAQPVKSVQEYDDERAAREVSRIDLQGKRRANALAEAATVQQTGDRAALQRYAGESGGDQNKLIQLLRGSGSAGLMGQADTLEKSMLGRRETESKIAGLDASNAKTGFETQEAKRKAAIQQITSLNSPEEAIGLLNQQVAAGAISMQAAQALERMVKSDPKWQLRLIVGISDPKEMMAALQPHMQAAGGALVNTNPLAGPIGQGASTAIPITQSEDNRATQLTAMRGQNMTDVRSREANTLTREAGANVYDADRGVLINKATGLARPAATMDGKPVGSKDKTLNDTQAKALLFGTRMQEAEKAFGAMAGKGVEQRGMLKRTAEGVADVVPFIGDKLADTAGTLTNFTQSPEQQQVEQAQRDWLNAVLRRESGAAIGASEFANGVKQYFPQPGDSPEVIAQKTKNRQLAARLMLEEVPESRRGASSAPVKPGSVMKFDASGNMVGQ